jgi:hypothetical protein
MKLVRRRPGIGFGLGLVVLVLLLVKIRLPGEDGGYLAICLHPDCRWRDFIEHLSPRFSCRQHPGETHFVGAGTRVSVRCFHESGCAQQSLPRSYEPGRHTGRDFQCRAHTSGA